MKDRNENRPGYKKTKVGWIPEEWPTVMFDDICERLREPVRIDLKKKYREIGIRSHGKGLFHKDQVNGIDLGNKAVFWVQSPALVFNIVFAWEQAVAVTSEREQGMIASHRFPMYGAKHSEAILDYVFRFFLSKRGKHLLGLASPGGAGRNKTLGQLELHKLLIPLPPIQEQRKITEILFACDKTISLTRKLVKAKKRRKKALMQQLLTGKTGLRGFSDPWKEFSLGELATIIFSNVDKKANNNEIPIRLCNYTDVYYNDRITNDLDLMKATATNIEIKKYKLSKNDVIITKDSETAGDIAIPCCVAEEVKDIVCGYHLAIIRPRPEKIFGPFLSYLLMKDQVHYQFVRIANGVTRFGLTNSSVKKIMVSIPSVNEQRIIHKVLSTADEEIEALQAKLSALEKQKRGLMQKLLTGEVRVTP